MLVVWRRMRRYHPLELDRTMTIATATVTAVVPVAAVTGTTNLVLPLLLRIMTIGTTTGHVEDTNCHRHAITTIDGGMGIMIAVDTAAAATHQQRRVAVALLPCARLAPASSAAKWDTWPRCVRDEVGGDTQHRHLPLAAATINMGTAAVAATLVVTTIQAPASPPATSVASRATTPASARQRGPAEGRLVRATTAASPVTCPGTALGCDK